MFINTRREARIAWRIAKKFGWVRPISYFYKQYVTNLFPGYQNFSETRSIVTEINNAIRQIR